MHNQCNRGAHYLAEERGTFERPDGEDAVMQPTRRERVLVRRNPLVDFLDARSRTFFAWVAEDGWGQPA